MCLAIPGQIKKIFDSSDSDFRMAEVTFGAIHKEVNISMIPNAEIGDFVLVHVGVAISKVDEEEAEKTFQYIREMGELDELENPSSV